MKQFFICDCSVQENKIITSSFVVVSKQVKPKKTGDPYLALTLGDRTGQIEAKMWDNVEDALDAFEQDDFLKIKGLINKYKNRFQLTIHAAPAGRVRNRLLRLPAQDHEEHRRTVADVNRLCGELSEPAPEAADSGIHGRS
jgi:DNA polymerase III alpha subunit